MTACAILAAVLVLTGAADYRAAAQDYVAALSKLRTRAPSSSIEDVYASGVRLGELLSSGTVMESMTKEQFDALRQQLPGFLLNRDEVLIAEPEPSYFLELAQRYGTPSDRAFFTLLGRIRPDSVWPVYVEQQTDYSGCTRFGQGALVDSYRRWREFRRRFPRAYVQFVARGLSDIEEHVAQSTCACGDADGTARELVEFAAAFPDSPAAPMAAARARSIREGHSAFRFGCVSG